MIGRTANAVRSLMTWKTANAAFLLAMLAFPVQAQEEPLPSGTYAKRGLVIGSAAGGAAGALFVGFLSYALCDYECDGALVGGAVVGGVGGAVLGGLTGLLVGAAIPRRTPEDAEPTVEGTGNPPPERPGAPAKFSSSYARRTWAVRTGVGLTGPVLSESGEVRTWMSMAILRPVSSRVDWGIEAGYLGTRHEVNRFTIPITQTDTALITTRWKRRFWSASLMALRGVGSGARPGGYLLATAGVYPFQASVKSTRTGDPPEHPVPPPRPNRSTDYRPGAGVGGGGRWHLGEGISLGVDSRLHIILGAPDELGVAVASLGGTLWLGG